ncbi:MULTISPECIES: tetratricopeptide repeat-containing sensor histidine kinase [unclassified Cellulophaga]|uniref:tetratricopeptide repeat-containing sensor histidine kinase n=1 Tax=unclassified Cellulophaga TaxID=2634405 RepID=UPI0026E170CE|nr:MULTISPECIES: HAMP domain-containing sensor histidine kinase [unclassified Cellulophaga]MDO6490933.1 HAMP domain-containing sensor histidine kinase [Cellulophaga sp. 2_MG-2023]MDO6493873.1 HAMP domain-containing sensor histidine kinase [Cellulophaga sp. 3_MG-2023]
MNNSLQSNLLKKIITLTLVCFSVLSANSQSKIDSIRALVENASEKLKTKEDKQNYIDLLTSLASYYRYENVDSLKAISDRVYKLSETINYSKGKTDALSHFAYYNSYQGDFDLAIKQITEALNIAEKIDYIDGQISLSNQLGSEYAYIGKNGEALKAYLKGADLALENDEKVLLSFIKDNTASLYASQKDYKQSIALYKEVDKLNKEIGNPIYIAETYANMSDIYIRVNELDLATKYIDNSIATFEKKGDKEWLSYCYINKGRILIEQKQPELALKWLSISENILKELTDDRTVMSLENAKAKAYLSLKQMNKAETAVNKAIEIGTRFKLLEELEESYETLYQIHKQNNKTDLALESLELFKKTSDSILRRENSNSLGAFKTRTEYERQKRDTEADAKKEIDKHQNYLYIAIAALVVLSFILLLIKIQANTRKKLYNQLIEQTEILKKRENELENINKTKDKLFSIIGHDLRNPIAALQSLLDMFVSKDVEAEDFIRFIPKLKSDVDALFFTLTNLLSWSRTQMNGGSTSPSKAKINNLTQNNINLLAELAENKNISITNNIPANAIVWADKNQMSVVIRNLLSNAIKFTKTDGNIVLNAKETENTWIVSVKDSGIGIKPELIEELFTNESAIAVSYGTNNEKGTGLGLPLCKEMITNNKGTIWIESTLGIGSTFYFELPKEEI